MKTRLFRSSIASSRWWRNSRVGGCERLVTEHCRGHSHGARICIVPWSRLVCQFFMTLFRSSSRSSHQQLKYHKQPVAPTPLRLAALDENSSKKRDPHLAPTAVPEPQTWSDSHAFPRILTLVAGFGLPSSPRGKLCSMARIWGPTSVWVRAALHRRLLGPGPPPPRCVWL